MNNVLAPATAGSLCGAPTFGSRGFTLIELAIVMFIVALLLGGMLLPLSAQQDVRSYGDTQKILNDARDALLGYAMANDRLPCPAWTNTNGAEDRNADGSCNHPYDGFYPAATVGLAPVDSNGYLIDGWGGNVDNRVRYAVSPANTSALTTGSGMKTVGITALLPDLRICNTGTSMSTPTPDTADCAANTALATDAVAVIYSLGKNAGTGGAGTDETHNPNPRSTTAADRAFVNAQQSANFDDQMVWLSKGTLFNRLVAAGRLP